MNRDNEMAVMVKKRAEIDLFACSPSDSGRSCELQLSGQPVIAPIFLFVPIYLIYTRAINIISINNLNIIYFFTVVISDII